MSIREDSLVGVRLCRNSSGTAVRDGKINDILSHSIYVFLYCLALPIDNKLFIDTAQPEEIKQWDGASCKGGSPQSDSVATNYFISRFLYGYCSRVAI